MYLIPILTAPIKEMKTTSIVQIWMFLERNGTHCIEIDSVEEAAKFAEMNGFPLFHPPVRQGELVFLFVDPKCKELESFYTWTEIQPGEQPMREVWRPFLWVKPLDGLDVWGTNQYLGEIQITPNRSVLEIIGAALSG